MEVVDPNGVPIKFAIAREIRVSFDLKLMRFQDL